MTLVISDEKQCSNCGGHDFYEDAKRGEVVCTDCGVVASDHTIDKGKDWRSYNHQEWERRSRAAPLDSDKSTFIGHFSPVIYGRQKIVRLRQTQIRATTRQRWKSKKTANDEICRLASQLHLPETVKELAITLFKKEYRTARKYRIDLITAACVYLACRLRKIPILLDEIAKIMKFSEDTKVNRTKLAMNYRRLVQQLNLTVPIHDASIFVTKAVSTLGLPPEFETMANKILEAAKKKHLICGKSPSGIAAAILYICGRASDEYHPTQKRLATVLDTTEVTVRNRYHEIADALGIKY